MIRRDPTLEIIRSMKMNAQGCNKHLTESFLNELPLCALLRLTHPLDRWEYAVQLHRFKQITELEKVQFKENSVTTNRTISGIKIHA